MTILQRDVQTRVATNPFDFGADPRGIVDSAAALLAAEAAGDELSGMLPAGTYRITQDTTLTGRWRLLRGAVLSPDPDVTLHFEIAPECSSYAHHFDISLGGSVTFGTALPIVSPELFGAAGDGVADDYAALLATYAAVTAAGGGTLSFGIRQTYRIDQYFFGGPDWNGINHLKLVGCDGLVIDGNGSTISCKGDFNRPANVDLGGGLYQSYAANVIPLYLQGCARVSVRNLVLDGGVDEMTRDGGVVEGDCYGVYIYDTVDFNFQNVHAHHFATDNLYIGPVGICRRGVFDHCRFAHGGRQATSIIHARDLLFNVCTFEETGNTEGAYGSHAPGAGVDIEPDGAFSTGNITFIGSRFYNNLACFFSLSPAVVDNVRLIGCELDAGTNGTVPYQIIVGSAGVLLIDCVYRLGAGHLQIGDSTWGHLDKQRVEIRGGRLESSGYGLLCDVSIEATIDGLTVIGTHTAPSATQQPFLQNSKLRLRNSRFFRPTAAYNGGGSYDVVTVLDIAESVGNRWETDMVPAGSEHFANNYGASTFVRNDLYLPRTTQAFRPVFNSTHPAGASYSSAEAFRLTVASPALNGTHHNLAIGAAGIVRALMAGNATVTGFDGVTNGQPFLVTNTDDGALTLTLKSDDAGSTLGNRIRTPGGVDYVLTAGQSVWVWKDTSSGMYRVGDK